MDDTQFLQLMHECDPRTSHDLLPLVYNELRRLAAQKLSYERPGQTLQATALVHETYLRVTPVGSRQLILTEKRRNLR